MLGRIGANINKSLLAEPYSFVIISSTLHDIFFKTKRCRCGKMLPLVHSLPIKNVINWLPKSKGLVDNTIVKQITNN
jgi:hypothetical protein